MSASSAGGAFRPLRTERPHLGAAARLLRIDLRHNPMLWVLPVAAGLFCFTYDRKVMVLPPFWNMRTAGAQSLVVLDFITPVVAAAAWMGSREARRGMNELLGTVSRPRFTRLLAAWAAISCWAVAGSILCLAWAYWLTSSQASWGGPLLWPAAVAVCSMPAFAALGFAAGALIPSRLTAPVAGIAAFFVLALSTELIVGSRSYWQISPIVTGPWDIGSDPGAATFYPYLPDLPIAQLMFLAGLTVAVIAAALGLPRRSGARWLRVTAASAAAAGLVAAGTAVALAGTGRLDAHGMIAIPALHDAADGRPLTYTPVCSHGAVQVCLNPAFARYLPTVTTALAPVLGEIAGLPGAPVRISQAAGSYLQGRENQITVFLSGPAVSGSPPVYHMLLPDQAEPGMTMSSQQLGSEVRGTTGPEIIASLVNDGPHASAAQRAVAAALMAAAGLPPADAASPAPGQPCRPGPSTRCAAAVRGLRRGVPGLALTRTTAGSRYLAAARRFDALPALARRAWLDLHLTALRAGHVTLRELP